MRLLVLLITIGFCGCNSVRHELFLDASAVEQQRKMTHSTDFRTATLGDEMLSEGEYIRIPAIELVTPIKASIPGAMGLPFTFQIDNCLLMPSWKSKSYTYYEAPPEKSSATHAMLGSVVRGDDRIGIRVHRNNNGMEWYVDNSDYNKMRAKSMIWNRRITYRDNVKFKIREDKSMVMDSPFTSVKLISYGGYVNGNYQLTYREINQGREYEKDFQVPKAKSGNTAVSIKGSLIEIVSHTSLGVKFRVLRSFTR